MGKCMKQHLLFFLITTVGCRIYADIHLDDFKVRDHVFYTYDPTKKELSITLKNVAITQKTGDGSLGRLVGSYPNPDYKPFESGFQIGKPSPHCLVYLSE
jgi:hypothetical protein